VCQCLCRCLLLLTLTSITTTLIAVTVVWTLLIANLFVLLRSSTHTHSLIHAKNKTPKCLKQSQSQAFHSTAATGAGARKEERRLKCIMGALTTPFTNSILNLLDFHGKDSFNLQLSMHYASNVDADLLGSGIRNSYIKT
jgi:hypothetical protein